MDREQVLITFSKALDNGLFIAACNADDMPIPPASADTLSLALFNGIYAGFLMGFDVGALGL